MPSGGSAAKNPGVPNSQTTKAGENPAFQPSSGKPHKNESSSKQKGTKSGGPKTPAGKKKSAANSLRDGIFSDEVVIEGLGETEAGYEQMKQYCWDFFQPSNAMEQLQFSDFVNNVWRRRRVRHAERLYLQNRVVEVHWEHERRRSAEVDNLKAHFTSLFRNYVTYRETQLPRELEEVRGKLLNSSSGTDFLLDLFREIMAELEASGHLSGNFATLYDFCIGDAARSKFEILRILPNNRGGAQSHGDNTAYPKIKELTQTEREAAIEEGRAIRGELEKAIVASEIRELMERRQKLRQVEISRAEIEVCMSIAGQGSSDRFARAETQHERRMYKALSAWVLLRAKGALPSLPPIGDELP